MRVGYRVLECFAGAGGLAMGFHRLAHPRVRFNHVGLVEVDDHARAVLAKRWPTVPLLGDIRDLQARDLPGCDILAGGPPCQPASIAGKREGKRDDRWLWGEFLRLAAELRPMIVVAENPAGLMTLDNRASFHEIIQTLGASGYRVEWDHIPACAVGGAHERDRVFIVGSRQPFARWIFQEGPGSIAHQESLVAGHPQEWTRAGAWIDGTFYSREPRWPVPSKVQWPTPAARDGRDGRASAATHDANARPLNEVVAHWPTARAGDSKQGPSSLEKHLESGLDFMLTDAVKNWPTAQAEDAKSSGGAASRRDGRQEMLHGTVKNWPTPDSYGFNEGQSREAREARKTRELAKRYNGNGGGEPLAYVAKLWPAAVVTDAAAAAAAAAAARGTTTTGVMHAGESLTDVIRSGVPLADIPLPPGMRWPEQPERQAMLNPTWDEAHLGWPMGWTDLSCDEPVDIPGCVAPRLDGLDGASPQFDWEPPRCVKPVKGDARPARIRCVGNGVDGRVAATIARVIADALQ